MRRRLLRFVLLAAIVAVVPQVIHSAAHQLAPPYSPDSVDELFAAIAKANGMPDLKQTTLPPSYQEIRITDQQSSVCCFPTPILRLVAHDGGQRQGELLLFRILPVQGNPPPRADERCAPLRDQQVCVRTSAKSIDWSGVASTLNQLDAWSITEPCEYVKGSNSVSWLGHSGDLYIHRLIGRTFSAYRCKAPGSRTTIDSGRKANAVYQYFRQVAGPVPPE
jgi:hypothetical protein